MNFIRNQAVLFIITLIYSLQLSAQQIVSFGGRIIDDADLRPMPNVNILIEHSSIGTITNYDGRFAIICPEQLSSNYITISYLGYNELRIKISDLLGCDSSISIQRKIYQLREVEITGYSPLNILEKVISRIPENYGSQPIILTGFLRTKKMVNDTLAEFSECIIEDYKSGYYLYPKREKGKKESSTNIPHFIKGRVITDSSLINELEETDQYAYKVGSYFFDIVECYRGLFFDPEEFDNYTYFLTEMVDENDNTTLVITFDQKVNTKGLLNKGEVYIDTDDFAIKKIILEYSPHGFDWYNKHVGTSYTIQGTTGWCRNVPRGQTTFTYCKMDGIWFLHSIVTNYDRSYYHPGFVKEFHYYFQQELVILDYTRDPEKIASFSGNKQLGINENWDKIIGQVDDTFWDNFNYLPIEDVLRKTIDNMNSEYQPTIKY